MKKLFLSTAFLLLTIIPMELSASEISTKKGPSAIPVEIQVLMNRLEEIRELDKSKLNSTEKKELRMEVKSIKEEIKASGGLYLSLGALLLVIVLLILLL